MTEHSLDRPLVGPEFSGVHWIYYSGFYDGALSGAVRLPDDTRAWANCAAECDHFDADKDTFGACGWYRRYQLFQLTEQAWAEEAERHADFQRWVGMHTDIDDESPGDVRPQGQWKNFYDKWSGHLIEPRLNGAVLIGWFQL